jgi:hypothetical protein
VNIYSPSRWYLALCSYRKIRETLKSLTDESKIMTYITTFRDGLWPGGKLADVAPPRTMDERLRTKEEANRKLSALVPGRVIHEKVSKQMSVFIDIV